MLLTPETEERLKHQDFLRRSAVAVVRYMQETEGQEIDKIAKAMGVSPKKILDLLVDPASLTTSECWEILAFANKNYLPLEREIIRGTVLDEYNPEKRVELLRDFIRKANHLLERKGQDIEEDDRRVGLVVPSGTISFFGLIGEGGYFKMYLGLRAFGETLQVRLCRLSEDEATIGGDFGPTLPRVPEALNKVTASSYDPHWDHSLTVKDIESMIRWLAEGRVVPEDYFLECFRRWTMHQLGLDK